MPKIHDKVTGSIKPEWLKIRLRSGEDFARVSKIVEQHALNTICSSGMCPNKAECWARRTATLMIMGDICTRSCRFCATNAGEPLPLNNSEPQKVAASIKLMGLGYCVVTSVTRDDLPDRGASHWAATIKAIRKENPKTKIELLIPDMDASEHLLRIVVAAKPDVIGHNIETVERLTPKVRSGADYRRSLRTISILSSLGVTVKSGIIVGLGENFNEVMQTLEELRMSGCDIVTIGQYLQPTKRHIPVAEYIHPDMFTLYRQKGMELGFAHIESGPLVRSSYMAENGFRKSLEHRGKA